MIAAACNSSDDLNATSAEAAAKAITPKSLKDAGYACATLEEAPELPQIYPVQKGRAKYNTNCGKAILDYLCEAPHLEVISDIDDTLAAGFKTRVLPERLVDNLPPPDEDNTVYGYPLQQSTIWPVLNVALLLGSLNRFAPGKPTHVSLISLRHLDEPGNVHHQKSFCTLGSNAYFSLLDEPLTFLGCDEGKAIRGDKGAVANEIKESLPEGSRQIVLGDQPEGADREMFAAFSATSIRVKVGSSDCKDNTAPVEFAVAAPVQVRMLLRRVRECRGVVRDPSFLAALKVNFSHLSQESTGIYDALPDEQLSFSNMNVQTSLFKAYLGQRLVRSEKDWKEILQIAQRLRSSLGGYKAESIGAMFEAYLNDPELLPDRGRVATIREALIQQAQTELSEIGAGWNSVTALSPEVAVALTRLLIEEHIFQLFGQAELSSLAEALNAFVPSRIPPHWLIEHASLLAISVSRPAIKAWAWITPPYVNYGEKEEN